MQQPANPSAQDPASAQGRIFLLRLGELLQRYGTAAPRLEALLSGLSSKLGIRAQFFAAPTSLLIAYGDNDEQRTHLLRLDSGEVELGKLADLDELIQALFEERIDLTEAQLRLNALTRSKPRHGTLLYLLAFGLSSGCAAALMGGREIEIVVSGALGFANGLLRQVFSKANQATTRLYEPMAAFLTMFAIYAISPLSGPIAATLVMMSAMIILLPGLGLTVAMSELATGHLVAGTTRLAGVLSRFLTIGFGIALAQGIGQAAFDPLTNIEMTETLSVGPTFITLVMASIFFAILFRARVKDMPVIVFVGVAGFFATRLCGTWLEPQLAGFAGAIVIGVASNTFARLFHRPASIPLWPSILLLVPGTIGFRSMNAFLGSDALVGTQAGFQATFIAMALVAGLLLANAIVPPRRML